MQSSLYVSLSAQRSLLQRLESIASNVANVSTPGYRAEEIAFSVAVSDQASQSTSFSTKGHEYISRKPGPVVRTDNPLDLAITGDAWFSIEHPQGAAYTRDGRFQISANGELVSVGGARVLDAGGAGIQLDPRGGRPAIGRDGSITQDGRLVGVIGLFQIPESALLQRAAGGAVIPSEAAIAELDVNNVGIVQGHIERSNVDPILEMTRLISLQRLFDAITNTVSSSESSMNDSIRSLAG